MLINVYKTFIQQSEISRKYAAKVWLDISQALCTFNCFSLARVNQRISIYFRRGGEAGGYAWRWSAKFHGGYVKQHYTASRGSPDHRKTVLPDFHLPHHVTLVNRHFRKLVGRSSNTSHFYFSFCRFKTPSRIHVSKIMITLSSSHILRAETLRRWNPNVRERRWQIPHGIKEKPICE